jgi:hypothetical protein
MSKRNNEMWQLRKYPTSKRSSWPSWSTNSLNNKC